MLQHSNHKFFLILILLIPLILAAGAFSYALADFSSTNFTLENPINIIQGGESSSASFQYLSSTGQLTSGQGTSTSFVNNVGFLYFPTATSPSLSATPGDSQVVLTWTAAVGTLANITSYEVGISASSGGVYTYTSVGNVLTDTRTGLTNGITYFFKVRSYADGLLLSESAEVSATPVAPTPGDGGSSGGGGSSGSFPAEIILSGRAYPLSKVSVLKDGQLAVTTIAGPDSNFTVALGSLSTGNYNFSVYGEDKNGKLSSPFTFQIYITRGVATNVGGIFISPTIAVDKKEVKRGENIVIFGQSSSVSDIVISVNSEHEIFKNTKSDASGAYLLNFDTSVLETGGHSAKSKALKSGEISDFGYPALFAVGSKTLLAEPILLSKCDLNEDGRCNLVDFSIAAYWYKRPLVGDIIQKEIKYLNGDGTINLIDFSIMAFYWTG
ncbi:MAG: hypothetical protein Q8P52_01170 [bacterium]|nr:hypothetical protein [bacterium]